MGYEIRKVPPNWEHPIGQDRYDLGGPQRMYDQNYTVAVDEWLAGLDAVRNDFEKLSEFFEDNQLPNKEYYRPWKDEEATWFQVWENVSEGTPITPPFETKEELIDYLVNHGDFWHPEKRYDREVATHFVMEGVSIPDFIIMQKDTKTRFFSGIDTSLKNSAEICYVCHMDLHYADGTFRGLRPITEENFSIGTSNLIQPPEPSQYLYFCSEYCYDTWMQRQKYGPGNT